VSTLVLALPELPDRTHLATCWWLVNDGAVLSSGQGTDWMSLAPTAERVVALAPTASVRIGMRTAATSATPRQAAAAARIAELDESLGDNEALHATGHSAAGGEIVTAIVDNGVVLAWLDWLAAAEVDPDHIVPVAALLPLSADWTAASFGTDHVVGRRGTILPNEPELVAALIGSADVRTLAPNEVEAALLAGVRMPAVDLRTGRFARRRRIVIDRARIRELALLTALLPLLTLAWAVISILKLEASTDRLNADTLRRAEAALGRPVTLETAESELAQRDGRSAGGGLLVPLTGLYQVLQPEPGVSTTNISYGGDGTMSATIAGPTIDVLNRVLIGLQRNGYQVTAVPRQGSDGRAMIDMTVRGGT